MADVLWCLSNDKSNIIKKYIVSVAVLCCAAVERMSEPVSATVYFAKIMLF